VTEVTRRAWESGTGAPMGTFDPATGELLGAVGSPSPPAGWRGGRYCRTPAGAVAVRRRRAPCPAGGCRPAGSGGWPGGRGQQPLLPGRRDGRLPDRGRAAQWHLRPDGGGRLLVRALLPERPPRGGHRGRAVDSRLRASGSVRVSPSVGGPLAAGDQPAPAGSGRPGRDVVACRTQTRVDHRAAAVRAFRRQFFVGTPRRWTTAPGRCAPVDPTARRQFVNDWVRDRMADVGYLVAQPPGRGCATSRATLLVAQGVAELNRSDQVAGVRRQRLPRRCREAGTVVEGITGRLPAPRRVPRCVDRRGQPPTSSPTPTC
jgi:hypothetical protein